MWNSFVDLHKRKINFILFNNLEFFIRWPLFQPGNRFHFFRCCFFYFIYFQPTKLGLDFRIYCLFAYALPIIIGPFSEMMFSRKSEEFTCRYFAIVHIHFEFQVIFYFIFRNSIVVSCYHFFTKFYFDNVIVTVSRLSWKNAITFGTHGNHFWKYLIAKLFTCFLSLHIFSLLVVSFFFKVRNLCYQYKIYMSRENWTSTDFSTFLKCKC